MSQTEQHIKRIHDKLQQLLKEHAALQKENQKLREELNSVEEKMEAGQATVGSLQQQISILKLSGGEMNDADKKEFEKRINAYIKEIDRCIALLGK
ncbi:MAG: hypothetical protein R2796_03300 [Chitinophagaceae bacterium]|nr:hypothetical protein [Chitinophagaceae bacterium]MCB0740540.1 hypothetical protein [Chitinophagaceae bacterium]HQU55933.1 hypothetical protein [Chitinophagaceae bacterium]HQV05145.1 hypothetical protein [Chitinophagaceae bacterium]